MAVIQNDTAVISSFKAHSSSLGGLAALRDVLGYIGTQSKALTGVAMRMTGIQQQRKLLFPSCIHFCCRSEVLDVNPALVPNTVVHSDGISISGQDRFPFCQGLYKHLYWVCHQQSTRALA